MLGHPVLGTCCDHAPDLLQSAGNTNRWLSIEHWPRLHRYQVYIEAILSDVHHIALGLDRDLMPPSNEATTTTTASHATSTHSKLSTSAPLRSSSKTPSSPATTMSAKTSAVLSDLQRTLHAELWGVGPNDGPATSPPGRRTHPSPLHVVAEVNDTLAQQRMEQLTKYLDVLNHRATRKKQILASLLSLWQSAKLVLKEHQQPGASATSTERDRAVALPKPDIVQQTRSIQDVLLHDMQRVEPTKVVLLEDRIALLRRCVENGDIVDDDGVLQRMCAEVDAMRASLLQANNDAIRLSARILQHLDSV